MQIKYLNKWFGKIKGLPDILFWFLSSERALFIDMRTMYNLVPLFDFVLKFVNV